MENDRSDATFWAHQQSHLRRVLATLVPFGARVVFLDLPVYMNVGDLMIYLGTERWMKARDLRILGRWSLYNFRFPDLPPDVTILLQGGGNFGDLYPFQAFREKVVQRYPEHRIVFLPQTTYFHRPSSERASRDALVRHPDLHLLVRDRRSLETVTRLLPACHCELAPDMSNQLYPFPANLGFEESAGSRGTVYLLRADRERCAGQTIPELGPGWRGDWRDLLGMRFWHLRGLKLWHLLGGWVCPATTFAVVWQRAAERALQRCAARFARASHVVTSRLHGHLLAAMLGVDHTILDNSYGKNSSYYDAWSHGLPCARLVGADLEVDRHRQGTRTG